jgi:hypothetical protein
MKLGKKGSGRALRAGVVLPLVCGALALGCSGTRIVSGGPFAGVVQTPEGTVRYSLAKTVVVIEAAVTNGASGWVTFDGDEFHVDTRLARKHAQAAVSFQAVVDEDQFFTLRMEHGDSSDDAMSVEVAPNGLLRSVGFSSSSQIGQTIRNVTTIAASVVAGIAAATLSADPRKKAAALVCEQLAAEAGTPGRCPASQPPATAPTPPKATTRPGTKAADTGPAPGAGTGTADTPAAPCDRRVETSLADLSMANLYFLARSAKHRRLWTTVRDAESLFQERSCRRAELERSAERATGKGLEEVRARVASQRDLEAAARMDLYLASEELDAAVRHFQLETGIDAPHRTEVVRMTLDLDEIPPPDMLRRAALPEPPARSAGMTDADVRAALKSFPRMLELYERTGIALTLTPPPYAVRGGTVWSQDSPGVAETRIYYRPSYTAVLTTYATSRTIDEQGGEQELLRMSSVASDDVVHPKMPVQGFSFAPQDFADRKLGITFDDMGRLARLDQAGRSAAAGASGTAADAIRIARDEYADTLMRIAQIQDSQRLISQNDLITELDRLMRQRHLLEERLELAGTRGSYDLLLEKKRLDAELGVLQSRRYLAGEKGAPEVSAELQELRSKLDQLARELEALKRRSDQPTSVRP